MKVVEPLSLTIAKTLADLLEDSVSSISLDVLAYKLNATSGDVRKVIENFSQKGLVRLVDNQIYLTEEGQSKVA
ncbi:hypothetical protein GCM10009122_47730 [Fulvivirga kasyanovii]|uniref:MarR family transcriptional regulator n=1 Tax=Fulvivirga kasyanovii TaxID=396812 RepID=A0ABW9RR70_9BACT|nr:hypothetical protein [Fulvivirga kasyanovii]MTI26201.1 hypothetical protein [Fulvivirga kasyanovii]